MMFVRCQYAPAAQILCVQSFFLFYGVFDSFGLKKGNIFVIILNTDHLKEEPLYERFFTR